MLTVKSIRYLMSPLGCLFFSRAIDNKTKDVVGLSMNSRQAAVHVMVGGHKVQRSLTSDYADLDIIPFCGDIQRAPYSHA